MSYKFDLIVRYLIKLEFIKKLGGERNMEFVIISYM